MKRILCLTLPLFLILGAVQAQNNANANIEYKGKLLFVNSTPTNPYTVVGKAGFSNSKKNVQAVGADPTGIKKVAMGVEDALKMQAKGKQKPFDAVIVYSPIKMELIKFTDGGWQENTDCTVGTKDYSKKCGEKEIFFMSVPNQEYDEVKVIEVKNFTNLGQMRMGKNDIDNFLNKLYERGCKEADEVDFDAILLEDANIVVNGFIETKTLVLIKYK